MQNYYTFDFNVPNEFLITKLDAPAYITVEYAIRNNKVVLFNLQIRPSVFALLKDRYSLHDIIYRAAENNAANLELFTPKGVNEVFVQIFDQFKMNA